MVAMHNLTNRQIDRGVNRAMHVVTSAVTDGTRLVAQSDVDAYHGRGKTQLNKLFHYAQNVAGTTIDGERIKKSVLTYPEMRDALEKLANGLKSWTHSEKPVSKLSSSGQSLARFIQATM